jgi:geranylgeranyl diphosphate synthase type II
VSDVEQILRRDAETVTAFLRDVLASYPEAPPRLIEAIEYSLLAGGKRLRPALVIESWRACDGPEESFGAALAAAGAIELVHTFSLVHDDLPAMDDDELRRGRPTNHKVFGEAMAILAGDAMLTMAFDVIARHAPPQVATPMIRELASASGPQGMIGGQVLDMQSENQSLAVEQLQDIHRRKTAALLVAACRLGATAAGAATEQLDAVTTYARHLGLAFQIVDDLLDVTSTPQQLGKATHKDKSKGKNTYPALLGVEGSGQEAQHQLDQALASIQFFSQRAAPLAQLAQFVVHRSS